MWLYTILAETDIPKNEILNHGYRTTSPPQIKFGVGIMAVSDIRKTGMGGPYGTAITMDGEIVAGLY